MSRVKSEALRSKIMSAEDAAALIPAGSTVGMSGFTGSGYPKAAPQALPLAILGIETGFEVPGFVVIAEQDVLGDRLIRAPRRRQSRLQSR